jgi:hypothetical protein
MQHYTSNHDFDKKKEKYLKDRVSDYPRSLKVTAEKDWSIAKIKASTIDLVGSLLENP